MKTRLLAGFTTAFGLLNLVAFQPIAQARPPIPAGFPGQYGDLPGSSPVQALQTTQPLLHAATLKHPQAHTVVQQPSAHPTQVSQAAPVQPTQTSFFCGESQGHRATLAQTARGQITVIRWVSNYFSGAGWDPATRCNEVSRRFQTYSQTGALQYVTTGYINRLPVICVAKEMNGQCVGLLLTLKPGTNPGSTLQRLMNISAFGAAPLNESTSSNLYINMKDFLQNAPVNP